MSQGKPAHNAWHESIRGRLFDALDDALDELVVVGMTGGEVQFKTRARMINRVIELIEVMAGDEDLDDEEWSADNHGPAV